MAVSADGSMIAHVEPDRISLVDGVRLEVVGEIGIDPEAEGCDVALCGDPLRLVVLARHAGNARLHLIDPRGPSAVGELPLKAGMRLLAVSGDHVWLAGASGSTVVNVVKRDPVLTPLALRAPASAIGTSAEGRFVVSTGGMIEEWDPETRAPARRFRLAKPTPARFVGGGPRQLWLIPVEGDRIELIPLVNVGQPSRIDLPEPPARVAADASHETLAIIGATTGDVHIIDLSGKVPTTVLEGVSGSDLAWLGTSQSLVVTGIGLEVIAVAGRPRVAGGSVMVPTGAGVVGGGGISAVVGSPSSGSGAATTGARPAAPASPVPTAAPLAPRPSAPRPATPRPTAPRPPAPRVLTAPSPTWDVEPSASGWRDELAAWARAILAGTRAEAPAVQDGPGPAIAQRVGLLGELADAMWLIYGAHLGGVAGVSALDLIAVIGRRWDEALGRGRLAASGALRWRRSQIGLWPEVLAALDELPVGGALLDSAARPADGLVAVVAPAGADLVALVAPLAPRLGPLLVGAARDRRPTARRVLEARVRGAVPVLRWPPGDVAADEPPASALLVVADEADARAAGAALV